jgi:hypothetical protein
MMMFGLSGCCNIVKMSLLMHDCEEKSRDFDPVMLIGHLIDETLI